MHRSLGYSVSVLLVLAGLEPALGQQPIATESQQAPSTDQQQKQSQETPSGQLGTNEPTTHAPSVKPPDDAVLVNGALAVPGAPAQSDTVPAKFSAKNAADDKLITLAYTFKMLTSDQQQAIYQALKDRPAGVAVEADVGVELPPAIQPSPIPEELAHRIPETRGYHYIVAAEKVLLVAPGNRIIVAVLKQAPAAQGAR